nr:hypothetical protein I302_02163 [Kwoniella bestiolae CBS 10118]OCF27322.1 hypothetical protein I302_02163 [Kwoniella bestiolae CBS 10118]
MIGDVNLFLPDGLQGQGECEIMIASKEDRRKGYAVEALSLFLSYLTTTLPLDSSNLIARIGSSNKPSIRLFQKLGFGLIKHVKVFDEVEMNFGKEDDGSILSDLGLESDGREQIDWKSISLDGRIWKYD